MAVMVDPVQTKADLLARVEALNAVAEDLAGELMLRPLLERILRRCTELMGCDAGSISSVDEVAGTYRKEADIGIRCQSGQVFPLDEGMTGEVVRRRGPAWFDRYEEVAGGHIRPEDQATFKGVIGVPLQWRGRIIGVCVVFSRDRSRVFSAGDADLLRMFAKHATVALVNANTYEAAEERARAQAAAAERERLLDRVHNLLAQGLAGVRDSLESAEQLVPPSGGDLRNDLHRADAQAVQMAASIRRTLLGVGTSPLDGHSLDEALRAELRWAQRARGLDARLVIAGTPKALERTLAQHVLAVAQEAIANVVQHARAQTIRLGLVYDATAVSLLVQDDGQGFPAGSEEDRGGLGLHRMTQRANSVGGAVSVDSVPGWGTRVRARVPYHRSNRPQDRQASVLIVATQPIVRAGLARLLAWSEPGVPVVGEVCDGNEALDAIGTIQPGVVVLGNDLTDDVAELTRRMLRTGSPIAVVAMCAPGDYDAVAELMAAGAHGCVEASADGAALARAVTAASRGEPIVPSGGAGRGRPRADSNSAGLTVREREVRQLIEQGLSDKAIARELVIAVKTAEKHVGAILRKTGMRSRAELIAARGNLPR